MRGVTRWCRREPVTGAESEYALLHSAGLGRLPLLVLSLSEMVFDIQSGNPGQAYSRAQILSDSAAVRLSRSLTSQLLSRRSREAGDWDEAEYHRRAAMQSAPGEVRGWLEAREQAPVEDFAAEPEGAGERDEE